MDPTTEQGSGSVTTTVTPAPVLQIESISKTYPGQVALADAAIDVLPGEVHALVGQNGSGKSTLIKLLAGYVRADHGAVVRLDGRPVDLWHLDADDRRRIRVVHQDLGLVPTLSTIENLGLGRGYLTGAGGRIRWRAEAARAQELLLRFGLAPDVRQPVATLSAAERTAVAIVRALQDDDDGTKPALLILDEPTASLDRSEVDALFREVRRVAAEGVGVLFVSHVLDEVLGLADRITVLRDGRVVGSGIPAHHLDESALVELIVGRSVDSLYPPAPTRHGRPVLEAEMVFGITLRGVSLKIHRGEVLGIAGLVGSGRDEIAGALYGATPRFAGKVLVDKCKVFATPRDSLRAGMAFVPADRKVRGLDPQDRLVKHVPLPRLGPAQRGGVLRERELRADVAQWVDALDVQPPLLERRMEKFSGGNQQKAVLARWLRTEPKVLLLDEPTQGVDIGAKASIYARIAESAAAWMAVLVTSSDAEELVHLCDRVLVMRAGTIAAELAGDALSEERLVAETLGATSNRKTMKVAREPIRFTVLRDDHDAPPEPVEEAVTEPAAPEPVVTGGRFATMVRRLRTKLRGGAGS
ncbi:MAG: sugar ABC transporter ATP-binding protein [Ilumatobacteraceae bacterium]|nr:sugar ABC transporter ATP-binding protein [Ilumatobacteraceae bacterium]